MEKQFVTGFHIFSDPLKFYNAMLEDIGNAKKCIYLEMYKFASDVIGEKFRDAITRKSREGIEIKLLVDAWGTSAGDIFFAELIRNGGEVRYFKRFRFNWDWFTRHHSRNHRKLLIIDNEISYLGSANLTAYSLNWRELVVRLQGPIALVLRRSFFESRRIFNKLYFNTKIYSRVLTAGEFHIIREVPSITRQQVKRRFEELIRSAEKQIIIESPYFLPGFLLRKFLMDAARRGVQVTIITPKQSDVSIADALRNRYLGILNRSGIDFMFYTPYNLHAKLMVVDDKYFAMGSSNFDYRSFRYMHEIMITGKDSAMIAAFIAHTQETLTDCESFDYVRWLRRPVLHKVFEAMLVPFRHFL